jgi:hypothetical protein
MTNREAMDEAALQYIEDAANAASQTTWHLGTTPGTREEARQWMIDCFDAGEGDQGHMVVIQYGSEPLDESSLCVAFTGNGPNSAANAEFIAVASPNNVLAMVREIRRLLVHARCRSCNNLLEREPELCRPCREQGPRERRVPQRMMRKA